MAITNFIPEIWSAAVAEALQDTAVLATLFTSEYEGDANKGNQVHITGVIPPTVNNYATGAGGNPRTTVAQNVTDDGDTILINQEKSFDFYVDDIDRVQAAGSFEAWTTAAGRALGEDADSYIGAQAVAGGVDATAAIEASVGGPVNTAARAWDCARDMRKRLNKAKVPNSERYLVMNAEFEALFLSNDAKLTSVDTSGVPDGLREAILGRILGFTLVTSNQLAENEAPHAFAAWRPSLAYVSQIDTVEALRANDRFADRVRGLHVYGGKVLDVVGYNQGVQYYLPDVSSSS
jgi:hypothetical protein